MNYVEHFLSHNGNKEYKDYKEIIRNPEAIIRCARCTFVPIV